MATLVFYLFVALVVVGGAMAALSRPVLYAIIGLGISLFGVAGLFLQLGSPFVAAMQLLIYLGGITVAIVFAMMLSNAMAGAPPPRTAWKTAFAALCAVAFAWGTYGLLGSARFVAVGGQGESAWAVARVGRAFLGPFNLAFEGLSVVLLAAIIGAILIARRPRREGAGQEAAGAGQEVGS